MSYPSGQFTYGDNYSTPPTPLEGFPTWETVEREQEHQQLQQQQQQVLQDHQQSSQDHQHLHHSPTQQSPTFQFIQLEEAHSQSSETQNQPSGVDNAPVHLHPIHPTRSVEGRLETQGNIMHGMFRYIDYQAISSSSGGGVSGVAQHSSSSSATSPTSVAGPGPPPPSMAVRSARSTRQYHQSLHPYQRPSTTTTTTAATSGTGSSSTVAAAATAGGGSSGPGRSSVPMTMREAQVSGPGPFRFVHHNLTPGVPQVSLSTTSAISSAMPSPASAPGRMVALGSVASSPVAQLQQSSTLMHASPRIPDHPPSSQVQDRSSNSSKTYIPRADTDYDPETGTLTIMLELPGVEKKDVRLCLITARHNRVRQLKVCGTAAPAFPTPPPHGELLRHYPGSCARERKVGEFVRSFSVPYDLKREDVKVVMKRGILIVKLYLGPPLDNQDIQEIPIN